MAFLAGALAKDPATRPQSAREFIGLFASLRESDGSSLPQRSADRQSDVAQHVPVAPATQASARPPGSNPLTTGATIGGPAAAGGRTAPDGRSESDRSKRTSRVRPMIGGLAAATALIIAMYVGANWWANTVWHVDVDGDTVVQIYRGRPEGFLWIEPTAEPVDQVILLGELTAASQEAVLSTLTFPSLAEAEAFLASLQLADS